MRRWWILGLALVASCTGASELYLAAPEAVPGAQTVVLFVEDSEGESAWVLDGTVDVWTFAVGRWGGTRPAEVTFTVAYYADAAAASGLALGALQAATSPRACGLRDPLAVKQAGVVGGVADSWTSLDALPATMNTYVVGAGADCTSLDLCTRFTARVDTLPGSVDISIVHALDDASVLVADIGGRFWRSYEDGRVVAQRALSGLPSRAAALGPDGRLWLVGSDGRVATGRFGGGEFEVEVVDAALTFVGVDVAPGGEVVLLGARNTTAAIQQPVLLSNAGDGWRYLGEIDVDNVHLRASEVHWLEGGQAVATYGGASLLFFDGDEVKERILGFANPIFDIEINGFVVHSTLGTVMVVNDGRLYRGFPPYDTWVALSGAELSVGASGAIEYGEGLVFGGVDGAISEYVPGGAPCPSNFVVGSDADHFAQVRDRLVVSGKPQDTAFDNAVTWLVPTNE